VTYYSFDYAGTLGAALFHRCLTFLILLWLLLFNMDRCVHCACLNLTVYCSRRMTYHYQLPDLKKSIFQNGSNIASCDDCCLPKNLCNTWCKLMLKLVHKINGGYNGLSISWKKITIFVTLFGKIDLITMTANLIFSPWILCYMNTTSL